MRVLQRSDLLDYATYSEQREETRSAAMIAKSLRRVVVGKYFTFLFENRETIRYQIQEMMRIERIVKEADIHHELDTYNQLIHPRGILGCTLMVGIDDETERYAKLTAWLDLNKHVYARLPNGTQVRPTWDPRQVGEDRLSSVQYLAFELGDEPPTAVGIDMAGIEVQTTLTDAQREALREDLNAS